MRLVFDTESDGLKYEATRIWCICAIDPDTGERYRWGPGEIRAGLEMLAACDDGIIGHNIINHDLPLLVRLYPDWSRPGKIQDTFILSSLVRPDRTGGHSIENFGQLFGRPKPVHEDWTEYSEDMLHRCMEDTEIGLLTYKQVIKEMDGWDWQPAIDLEYEIAEIHAQQELNGVNFDVEKAKETYNKIQAEIDQITEQLGPIIPKQVVQPYKTPVSKPFLKSGDYSNNCRVWMGEQTDQVSGPFSRVRFENTNLDSPEQIKEYLLTQGWKPTQWNYKKDGKRTVKDHRGRAIKTSPKLTEDSYGSIEGDVPKLVARYYILRHRRNLIKNVRKRDNKPTGWLNIRRSDGKISAGGIPQGTPTGRYRHYNIVNVPKAEDDVVYGKEMRELFIPTPGMLMVGNDAKALENRMEAHYTSFYDGGEYAESLLQGDPHTKNALAFSEACQQEITRSKAKNVKYAITYGAQPAKVAETAGVKGRYGKILYEAFWQANPALASLRGDVEMRWKKRGYLIGIDGRRLHIRSDHALLNTLFQAAGSLVVKKATCLCWNHYLPEAGLRAKLLIHQHDEWQAEVFEEELEKYIELSLESFVQSGIHFNLNIPIEGDVKVGNNWAETH